MHPIRAMAATAALCAALWAGSAAAFRGDLPPGPPPPPPAPECRTRCGPFPPPPPVAPPACEPFYGRHC